MVAKSITEFGWQQPLVIDANHHLIAGHTRLEAAKLLKIDHVPAVIARHLTPDQIRAYRIADNRTADFTSWDFTELTEQLDDLSDEFSDVLGLENWDAVINDYEEKTNGTDRVSLHLPTETDDYLQNRHQITVVFDSDAHRLSGAEAILDLPGVIDVRHKR